MIAEGLNYGPFQAKDIHKLLGIDKNKLFYWIKTHRLLKPEIELASGTGSRSKFSLKNLLELATVKELLSLGFDLSSIKKIMRRTRTHKEDGKNIFKATIDYDEIEREDIKLYIYRLKNKIILYLTSPIFTVDEGGAGYYPDWETWDKEEHPEKPPSYSGAFIQVGILANDLMKKIKRI